MNVARPNRVCRGPELSTAKAIASMIARNIDTEIPNSCHHQNSALVDRPLKSKYLRNPRATACGKVTILLVLNPADLIVSVST